MLVNVERIVRGQSGESPERFVEGAISARERASQKFDTEQADAGEGLSDLIRSLAHERPKTMAQEVIENERHRQQIRGISIGM